MTTTWGTLTIGSSPVQVSTNPDFAVCKLSFQVAPSATGAVKLGAAGVTANDSTPGTYLNSTTGTNPDSSPQPGGMWAIESHTDHNDIVPAQYFVQGSHAGDLVFYEYSQN
jgi:hypothetical protein